MHEKQSVVNIALVLKYFNIKLKTNEDKYRVEIGIQTCSKYLRFMKKS